MCFCILAREGIDIDSLFTVSSKQLALQVDTDVDVKADAGL
jgi:hypothetical protein